MSTPLEPSVSAAEFCLAWNQNPKRIAQLVKAGKVGHIRGKRREIRFLPEHLVQLRELLEVKPVTEQPASIPVRIGQTSRSAAIRARRSA